MSTRRDPFEEMSRMIDQMRSAVSGRGTNLGSTGFEFDVPYGHGSFRMGEDANLTMESTDEGFVVLADVPGFEKEEIDLRLDGDTLTISAERDVSEDAEGTIARRRRSVHERITIPESVVESDVTATYRNGVLEVHLPTETDVDDARRIDIE